MSHRYRVTVLTPLLAGSGELLSPIDYMVWQSEVRVLDQDRIFKLLARSPRLEAYLDQLRKSERLDWAQWGGYAQSYSSARVPFASAGLAGIWEKARNEDLYIPRFAHGGGRRLLPGSAIKGAFRTAWLGGALPPENAAGLWKDCMAHSDRWFTASAVEAASRRRVTDQLSFGDARTPADNFRIYQTRSLVLRSESKTPSEWKPGQQFAEMAKPGAVFEGAAEIPEAMFEPVREQSGRWLQQQEIYARQATLKPLSESIAKLREEAAKLSGKACMLPLGWGAGFASKTLLPDPDSIETRQLLTTAPGIRRSMVQGLPFPKTRRVALDGAGGAHLCGWAKLELI